MKLKLDMSCHLLNAYTKFEIDISKHVEKKSGKLGRTDGRTDRHCHSIIRPFFKRAYQNGWPLYDGGKFFMHFLQWKYMHFVSYHTEVNSNMFSKKKVVNDLFQWLKTSLVHCLYDIKAWINYEIHHMFSVGVITHPYPNGNSHLTKAMMWSGHGWLITSYDSMWP